MTGRHSAPKRRSSTRNQPRQRIDFDVLNVDPRTPVTVDVSGRSPFSAITMVLRAAGWQDAGGGFSVRGETLRVRVLAKKKPKA